MDPIASSLYAGANGATALVLVALAVVSIRRGPRSSYLRCWVAFCLLGALFTTCVLLAAQVTSPRIGAASARAALASATLATLSFLLFGFAFAGPQRGSRLLRAVGAVWAALLVVLFLATDLLVAGVTPAPHARFIPVLTRGMVFYLAYLAYSWVLPLALIVRVYRRSAGVKRIQAGYMLVAFAIACVASFGSLVPVLRPQRLLFILPHLLFPLYPLTITYAIVRHRLWDVRTIMHKTAVWLVLSLGLLLPIYALFRFGARWLLGLDPGDQAALLVVLFLLAHIYLLSVKPHLDDLFQRRIYDQRRVLDRFSQVMAGVRSPDDVVQQLLRTLAGTLYPESTVVQFRLETDEEWRCRTHPAHVPPPPPVVDTHPFVARMIALGGAVDRSQLETDARYRDVREVAESLFAASRAEVCLPLVHGGALIGLVHLGAKKNLRPYSRTDLEFAEQLGAAATVGLANGLLFERVDLQRRKLEEAAGSLELRVQQRTAELEELAAQLRQANEDLTALDKLKSRFFANVSHELRTPLTLILSPAESLLAGELGALEPRQQEQLLGVKRNALELLKLINDLLDLSRLEESRLKLRVGPLDLRSLAARVVDAARPISERKHIDLSLDGPPSLAVEGDEEKLERIAVNLLSNALKFTNVGGRVAVRAGERDGRVWLAVEDTGIGIPRDELERIFDRFHQVDPAITQRYGGTGIGLAMAKELAELHDGTLRVESELGRGSVFTLEIPKAAALPPELVDRRQAQRRDAPRRRESDHGLPEWSDEIQQRPEYRFLSLDPTLDSGPELTPEVRFEPDGARGTPGGETVLVVEDNPEVRRHVAEVLGRSYRVLTAPDGEAGLERARRELPALVLCDVMMPIMDGLTLCRRLKQDVRTAPIPVIMVTARKSVEDSVSAFEAGADDYITKPFSALELLARSAAQLRVRRLDQAVARAERMASLGSTAAGLAHEIRNPLNAIINGLETLEQLAGAERAEVMDVMGQSARRILGAVEALQSFVRLDEAPLKMVDLHRGLEDTLKILSHRLAGVRVHRDLRLTREVECFPALINQVLMNLLANALDAIGGEGELWLSTELAEDRARLRVRDSGPGVNAEERERIFRPYYTTKPVGSGTGMGLAISKQIVERHGGTLCITSPPGAGAELTIELPLKVIH